MQADFDNNGCIDYGEFIAATLHLNKAGREDHLFAAFQYFDKDGSGYITQDELQKACEEFGIENVHLEDMIREVDQDNVSICSLFFTCNANSKFSRICMNFFFLNHLYVSLTLYPGWSNRLQ